MWHTGRGYRMQAFINAVLGMLLVVTDLAFVWSTKLAIDVATGSNHSHTLRFALVIIVCIIFLQISMGIVSKWVRAILGVQAQNDMQQRLFHRLLMAQWRPLRKFHTGNLINRIEKDVCDVVSFVTESIPSLLTTTLQFLGAFFFLFWMDRTLAGIIALVIPFFLITSKLYMRRMRRITHAMRDADSQIQTIMQEGLQHSLIVKALEQVGNMTDKLKDKQAGLRRHILKKTKYSTISSGVMNLGFAVGYVITFSWGVLHLQEGLITYGSLIAFVQLVGQIQTPVRALTRFIPVFIGAFTAAERLMELERIPLETSRGSKGQEHLKAGAVGIAISHLSFSYEKNSRQIFRDFSYTFAPGSVTAILGETGSGKTTLIRHLLALVSPVEGKVCLFPAVESQRLADAREATQDPTDAAMAERYVSIQESRTVEPALRPCFSYVPQGNTLMSGSIRENLLLGNPQATEAELRQALHTASADFVFSLPEGMDTELREMGVGLSEGQAQRISIARALLRPAPILLLDEATSSLDAETEKTVLQNIMKSNRHRTLIFVTHRMEVLKYCSQTLQLKKERSR